MSAVPSNPFQPTTTPAIERANRLLSVRAHPGFLEILRISQEIIDETIEICNGYPGWDKDQIALLMTKMQAAKGHHARLLFKINEAIEAGTEEIRAQVNNFPEKTPAEIIEHGDLVRQEVLTKFAEMDGENRVSGSY